MAIKLPIGIRIAAGLLASTIDRIGKLPQELPTLGISLAGQAVRTSFRIRQEIAELATRGDEFLSGITGRPQEKPEWATFDDDEDPPIEPAATGPAEPASRAVRTPAAKAPTEKTPTVRAPRSTPRAKGPVARTSPTGDHRLSIAELKEELLDLGIGAVRELLVQEESGPNRAAYLTLLSNRLTTLEHENGQSESR